MRSVASFQKNAVRMSTPRKAARVPIEKERIETLPSVTAITARKTASANMHQEPIWGLRSQRDPSIFAPILNQTPIRMRNSAIAPRKKNDGELSECCRNHAFDLAMKLSAPTCVDGVMRDKKPFCRIGK